MNVRAEGLPPEYAAFAEQDITTYIRGDQMKTEQSSMMGSSVTYYDGKKMTSLTETMGTKIGFSASKQELETSGKDDKAGKPDIEYTSEKRTIAGYECTKVIIKESGKGKKDNSQPAILWVTDKIKYDHPEANKAAGKGLMDLSHLKGYPLGMEVSQNAQGMDLKIIMTATEVLTSPLDDSVFTVNTEGYTMLSYKEMLEKQKSMMQGR